MTDSLISRRALFWLLLAQFFALLPHALTSPLWVPLVWLAVVVWRWKIFAHKWQYPGRLVKALLLIICCGGLFLSFGSKVGTSGMVSLLLTGFILKLLEMKRQRDGLLLCFLGYLVVATQFLFFSTIFAAVYGLFCLMLLSYALLLLSVSPQDDTPASLHWRGLAVPVVQALALMLVLFLFFPRFSPFWAVPVDGSRAKTGMSDSMSPGSFGELMRSSAPAFRVGFDGAPPDVSVMYWRGLVFGAFDGKGWTLAPAQRDLSRLRWDKSSAQSYLAPVVPEGESVSYQVIFEPSEQPWLFVLGAVNDWSAGAALDPDLNLRWRRPISQRIQYSATSHVRYSFREAALSPSSRQQYLSFPASHNPQTLAAARQWRVESESEQQYINRVLAYFGEAFTYTLRPGVLGEHPVDDFLWGSKAGFCEHFASAFALMMRAADIPARVATGYLGGEYNATENYWLVRQRDAHAWVEIWQEDKGWVMIDPTASVAPERVEQGIDFSLDEADQQLLGNLFSRNLAIFNHLRLKMDALNYQWSRWVLNYDRDSQQNFFERWRELINWQLMGALIGGISLLILATFQLRLFLQNRRRDKVDVLYLAFMKKIQTDTGLKINAGETSGQFALRIAGQRRELKASVTSITALYERIKYGEERALLPDLEKKVNQFRV
ncbi:transglutaminase TgpA family protein [Cellvibrio polysaccharolyticus]|nr:DUF3488 and transglutaminase-like domain-containing protein [Cellvibrio polysaccharolyticus]